MYCLGVNKRLVTAAVTVDASSASQLIASHNLLLLTCDCGIIRCCNGRNDVRAFTMYLKGFGVKMPDLRHIHTHSKISTISRMRSAHWLRTSRRQQ